MSNRIWKESVLGREGQSARAEVDDSKMLMCRERIVLFKQRAPEKVNSRSKR